MDPFPPLNRLVLGKSLAESKDGAGAVEREKPENESTRT